MSSIDQQKKLVKRICQKYQSSPWLPLAQLQKATSLDTPARGGVWIARTSFSAPTNPAIRDVLYTVRNCLKKDYHRISPADQIILAGNSAGANLTLGLMKLLLEVQKLPPSDATFDFHGQSVALPLPAGLATVSRWCDQCDSLPSWHCNGETDILTVLQPPCMPGHPTDSIWPASPPREVPYCVAATLDHELVSPAAVEDWTGSPPMWFACGCEERGVDGNRVVASQAAKSGVTVIWNEYEGMPHEFPIFLSALPQTQHLLQLWAVACQAFAGGKIGARELQSGAVRWLMPDRRPMVLGSPVGIAPLPFEEVRKRMKEYNATRPVWTGKLHEHKL